MYNTVECKYTYSHKFDNKVSEAMQIGKRPYFPIQLSGLSIDVKYEEQRRYTPGFVLALLYRSVVDDISAHTFEFYSFAPSTTTPSIDKNKLLHWRQVETTSPPAQVDVFPLSSGGVQCWIVVHMFSFSLRLPSSCLRAM